MATTAYEKAKARKKARTATTETGTSAYQRAKERKAKRLTTPERKSGMLALYEQNQKETAIAPETKTTISTFKSPLLQGNKSRSTLVDKQADLNNSLLSVSQTGKMPKRIATQPLITPELGTKLSESYKKNFTDTTKPLPIARTPDTFKTGTEATGLEKGLYSVGKGLVRASGDLATAMGTVTQYVSEVGDRLAGRKTSEKNVIAEYFNKINKTADTLYNSMDMATDRGTGKTQEFVNGAIENFAYLVPTIASSLMSGGGTAATGATTLNTTAKTGIQYASKMVQSLKGMTAFMTQAAGGYMQESKDKGDSITTQMLKGTYGGLLEGITETIPFGYLEKLLGITGTKGLAKQGIKQVLATYGKNALANIITNVVQEIVVDPLAKTGTNMIGGEKSKLLGPGGILDAEVAERSALGALGLSLITIGLGLPVADIYNAAKYESFNKKPENMKKVLATEKEQTLNKTTTDMGLQAGQVSTVEQTAENAPSTSQETITATTTPEQGSVSSETVKPVQAVEETVGTRIKKVGEKTIAREKAVAEANETPIEDRTYKEVGKPKVKSYQWKHPELKPFIQEEAAAIHTELRNVIKGERYTLPEDAPELHPEKMDASAVGGVQTTGFKGYASASLRRIQEITKQTTGDQASYEEIKLALEQIIHDEGAENNALAKRIELIIDQNLTNGVTRDDFGKQYPNTEYIKTKRQVEGKEVTVEREPQEDDELPIMEEDFVKPVKKNVPVQFEGTKPGEAGYVPTPTEVVASKKGSLTLPKAKAKKTAFAFESERQESIYQANKGVKQPTFMDKIKEGITETLHAMTRPIATLPVNAENAQLYEKLQLLPKLKNMVSDDTVRTLDTGILKKDNIPDYKSFDNFSRTVYLKDLAQDAKLGYELPNEMTPETVKSELERLDKESTAGIKKALSERKARWQEIVDAKVKAYADIGMDISDVYSREDYFHHQVLEYMNAKEYMGLSGTGKKLATPPTRGFEKARSGKYTGMTNTDYLQAEYEVMAQMKYDTEVAKIIKLIESSKYNIVAKVKQDAKDKGLKDWHEAIPEGYDTWQPKEGNVFYLVRTLGEEVVENALALKNMELDDVKNPKVKAILQDVIDRLGESKEFLAMGGKRTELVLKQEVIDTLNNLTKMATKPIAAVRFSRALLNSWKRWVLTGNPRSILKYNIRNFSGDLDVTMAMDGKALRQVPKAMKELQDAFTNGKFTPELKSWYDQGAYQELLASQEIGEVNKMKPFERFREKTTLEKIATPLKNYERFTTKITNYREAVLRYAVYLESLADQKANGKVTNYGASKKSIIDALETPESKAHKISNEILGAYDEVSELGVVLARHLIPFYRFQEVNFKRYVNLFKNAATGGEKAKTVAGAVLKVGGKTAWTLAKVMLTLMMVSAWNTIVYPELEETLPDDVKSRSHIILGKNPKTGETIYFTRLGALQDFLEWFGLENATQDVIDILNGKKTVKEQITDMVRSPINKVVSSLSPYYKTTGELLTGKKLYPDIWNQGTINDKWQYAAQTFGLQKEYDVLAGKPHRPYAESLLEAVVYKSDPQEAAYWDIIDAKYDYLEKIGEGQSGSFARSKRSMALYYYKMALRYGDEKAQEKYLAKYKELGGTESGMNRSLASMDPLYGLSDKERADFLATLTESERETLKTAQQYYKTIKSNGTK